MLSGVIKLLVLSWVGVFDGLFWFLCLFAFYPWLFQLLNGNMFLLHLRENDRSLQNWCAENQEILNCYI